MGRGQGSKKTDVTELRRRAEARLAEKRKNNGAEDPVQAAEVQRLVQELQIHQIELEMQNEELTQARDEAEAERERYLDLYDFAPLGYFTLDSGGVILQANLTGALLLGVERLRLLNRRFADFVSESDVPAFTVFLKKVFEGSKESCDVSMDKGQRQRFCAHIEATSSEDGRECRVAVFDITERKKAMDDVRELHEKLDQQNAEHIAELETANKNLESFGYSISHDLQAPLRAIDGYARTILRRSGDKFDEDTRRRFEVIRDNIQKMGRLIDALLVFSHLGNQHLSSIEVDMDAVVEEVWKDLRASHPDKAITLRSEGLPPAIADKELIVQVVRNILSNAVKYAASRDEVIVGVSAYTKDNENVYFVKDNGVGFDMAYYGKMFGLFQRLHSEEEYAGTGVGLAIAHRIITKHGGRIWAESKVDEGSCVRKSSVVYSFSG